MHIGTVRIYLWDKSPYFIEVLKPIAMSRPVGASHITVSALHTEICALTRFQFIGYSYKSKSRKQ